MAENLLAVRSQVDQTAGRKSPAGIMNRLRCAAIQSAAAYTAPAQNDTIGTGLVFKQGTRFMFPTVSNAAGTASSTLSVGLRNPVTKVALDATALVNAVAFNAAQNAIIYTGTKLINGQEYYLTEDAEVYLTVGGAAGLANQQFRIDIPYVAP